MNRLLIALLFATAVSLGQGGLDPVAPPAAAMKRLNQVHPGTPIGSSAVTISTPGYYYLTQNISASGSNGITINSSDVTVNLNGFFIDALAAGVRVEGTAGAELSNVVISNGCIFASSPGVALVHACNCTLRDLTIRGGIVPLSLEAPGGGQCSGNRMERCIVYDNRAGIVFEATGGGSCDGNLFQSCIINGRATGAAGSPLSLLGTGGDCKGNTVRDCVIGNVSSLFAGILLDAESGGRCSGNTVSRCTISECANGIAGRVDGGGIVDGNHIEGCTLRDMSNTMGILLEGAGGTCRGNRIADCCISGTEQRGIYIHTDAGGGTDGNTITGCAVSDAAQYGILVTNATRGQIRNNHVTSVQTFGGGTIAVGIGTPFTATTGNIVTNNSCADMINGFNLSSSGTNGPVVTASGTLTNIGSSGHRWANFAR